MMMMMMMMMITTIIIIITTTQLMNTVAWYCRRGSFSVNHTPEPFKA
jgi:hypothetical protein